MSELTKFDVIIDEGRDGWTLFAMKNGGKHRRRRWGMKEMKEDRMPQGSPSPVLPTVWSRDRKTRCEV